MPQFVRKPEPITAIRWNGRLGRIEEVFELVGDRSEMIGLTLTGVLHLNPRGQPKFEVQPGQWLGRGPNDELFSMGHETFMMLYDPVPIVPAN
jgi:hypothetical protein